MPKQNVILPGALAGRCANGSEGGRGRVVHAVEGREVGTFGGGTMLEIPTYALALCGKTHGQRSAGWSTAEGQEITCPRSIK